VSASFEELAEELRGPAFGIAYRMLGSVAEAEDVVQEALVRLLRAMEGGEVVRSPRAFVSTAATRLAIDELRSARVRRERYVGEWIPEPLVADWSSSDDPAAQAELADSLSIAFLALLERLSPEQRAVFLLHDVFDYGYGEVAEIVGVSEANARQLAVRARRHVEAERPRFEASAERRDELAARFFAAARDGDLAALEALLADDVALHGDGGGKVPALARSLHGAKRVARTLLAWSKAGIRIGGATIEPARVNGQPGGLMLDSEGRVLGVMELEIAGDRIQAVHSIVNPDKLAHVGRPVSDLGALLARRGGAG
jgi:RNA polymerase sigma-70 factor (TIGR02957 family)